MRDTFLLEVDFILRPEKREELNASLGSLTWKEGAGHIRTSLYEEWHDPNRLLWVTEWADRESLNRYMSSDVYRALLGCLQTLGRIHECRLLNPNSAMRPAPQMRAMRLLEVERVQEGDKK